MSALLLLIALRYWLKMSWTVAVIIPIVACLAQAVTIQCGIPLSLFTVCLATLGLCVLRHNWSKVAAWKVWKNLDEYRRWRNRVSYRRVSIRPVRRWWWF